MTIKILYFTIISFLLCFQGHAQKNDLIKCWEEKYMEYNVAEQLNLIENQLLGLNIIPDTSVHSYSLITNTILEEDIEIDTSKLKINLSTPKSYYQECHNLFPDLFMDSSSTKHSLLLSTYLSIIEDLSKIDIYIPGNHEIYVNGELVAINEFKEYIKQEKRILTNSGVPEKNIVLQFKVDQVVKMNIVADIQEILRELTVESTR